MYPVLYMYLDWLLSLCLYCRPLHFMQVCVEIYFIVVSNLYSNSLAL